MCRGILPAPRAWIDHGDKKRALDYPGTGLQMIVSYPGYAEDVRTASALNP